RSMTGVARVLRLGGFRHCGRGAAWVHAGGSRLRVAALGRSRVARLARDGAPAYRGARGRRRSRPAWLRGRGCVRGGGGFSLLVWLRGKGCLRGDSGFSLLGRGGDDRGRGLGCERGRFVTMTDRNGGDGRPLVLGMSRIRPGDPDRSAVAAEQ